MGVLEGLTNREIGTGMGLKESSVKNILQALFSKAGVRTRGQLVRAALEGSLGDLPPLPRPAPAPAESTGVAQSGGGSMG
jgi:hypothetical protein